MAILKKPASASAFIDAAPDGRKAEAAPTKKATRRAGKPLRVKVNFTVSEDVLATFDALADNLGMTRSSLLALAMTRATREGFLNE